MSVRTEEELINAMKHILRMGPKIVVVTSSELTDFPGKLSCYTMVLSSDSDGTVEISRIIVEKIQGSSFTGTGDLSASLLLAWTDILERGSPDHCLRSSDLGTALRNTLESVQAALRRTLAKKTRMMASAPVVASEPQHRAYMVRATELCLVESRFDIMTPPRHIAAAQGADVVSHWKISFSD